MFAEQLNFHRFGILTEWEKSQNQIDYWNVIKFKYEQDEENRHKKTILTHSSCRTQIISSDGIIQTYAMEF